LFLGLVLAWPSFAQIIEDQDDIEYPISEFTVGINTNTVGVAPGGFPILSWISGINTRYARQVTGMHYASFQLEICNISNSQEYYARADSTNNLWMPGKINYLYSIRPMIGWEILPFRKDRDEGLQMRVIFAVGPSFGIVKPYMVLSGTSYANASSVPLASLQNTSGGTGLGNPDIFGDRPFDGFDKANVIMGINFKLSAMIEYGILKRSASGIEVGFQFESFSQKIILVNTNVGNVSTFTSAFLNIFFGSRR
jgi:hypothetical protein